MTGIPKPSPATAAPPAAVSPPGEPTPPCWRCKTRPGVVNDGTTRECVECAGQTAHRTRQMLDEIGAAVREGLRAWPRIMDRVEFVRECIKLHREDAKRDRYDF